MGYYFTKTLTTDFESALLKVTDELKNEGFGIVSEIDMKETMKNKLNVDFRKYKILGACNPGISFKAISAEPHIGTMLPCNIIIQEHELNKIEVSVVDPVASMMAVNNLTLGGLALEARQKMKNVIENLK